MSGTGYAAAGVAVIVMGDVLAKKEFSYKKVVGGAIATLGIAALANVDDLLSTRFCQLFLLGVAFIYAIPLAADLGLSGSTRGSFNKPLVSLNGRRA
jgi:hypothetical protein